MYRKLPYLALMVSISMGSAADPAPEAETRGVVDLGSRRELFVDDYLIGNQAGVERRLHTPVSRGVVFEFDRPWEGNLPFHVSVFEDGGKYRMYYRGFAHEDHLNREALQPGETIVPRHESITAYAESRDGIHWTRPNLDQVEFNGSSENNILDLKGASKFAPFIDGNPRARPGERYKALAFFEEKARGIKGLFGFRSDDGVRWERISEEPLLTDGVFDSHNTASWDPQRQQYVAFYRDFLHGVRSIKRAVSDDFLRWSQGDWIDVGATPADDLYTNSAIIYDRAPHLHLAFPKRFVYWRRPQHLASGTAGISEALFMSSRDGMRWHKFDEAFIRPGPDRRNWIHRSNLVAHGLLHLTPGEISMYVLRNYTYPSAHLERMVVRTDGFVSVHAGHPGGEMVTRPFRFKGDNLFLNYSTSAAGRIQVEVQDERGIPIPGYTLTEAKPIWGDEIDGKVEWERAEGGRGPQNRLSNMQGRIIRLRFVMVDADLYSLQFR